MANPLTFPLPASSTIKVTGFTNSGWWPQRIVLTLPNGQNVTWSGTGAQDNSVVGSIDLAPLPDADGTIAIAMEYDAGQGFQPSAMGSVAYEMDGLYGFVVGGQDAGGRGAGQAFWNTVVFVYWANGY